MTSVAATRRNALSDIVREPSGSWAARLRVDEGDRFFFDHELDHVPGMLLFEGMLQAAEHAAATDARLSETRFRLASANLEMTKLCEMAAPTTVKVRAAHSIPGQRHDLLVRVTQAGVTLSSGELSLAPLGPDATDLAEHPVPRPKRQIDSVLVHKRDPANVLVGPLSIDPPGYRADVLPAQHPDAAAVHRATLLVELVRQFGTMSLHVFDGMPLDWQILLTAVEISLPEPVPPGEGLHLWSAYRPRGGRRIAFSAEIRTDHRTLGTVALPATVLPKASYARLREKGRI